MDELLKTLSIKWVALLADILAMFLVAVPLFLPEELKEELKRYTNRVLGQKEPPKVESYSEKLASLMKSLTKASAEVDKILAELAQVAGDRHNTVLELEAQLTELEEHERQLQQRIQDLEKVPIPVAEHFAKMIAPGERRSAWRDYTLFAAGVIVSTVIAILLRLAGLG
jgi:septal ring factor EnvC (AmiA/AmiB activator)